MTAFQSSQFKMNYTNKNYMAMC